MRNHAYTLIIYKSLCRIPHRRSAHSSNIPANIRTMVKKEGLRVRSAPQNSHISHLSPPRHALKPRTAVTVLKSLGLTVLALALTGAGAAGTLYYKLQHNIVQHKIIVAPDSEDAEPMIPIDQKAGQALNILLLGSDARTPEEQITQGVDGMRGDTTMLLHISQDRSRVDIVSIPRDTLVDIPSCALPDGSTTYEQYDAMFNSAFMLGGATGDVGAAASCTLSTVQQMTDVPIDGFVVVDFHSFEAVVDSIGGVEMCFTENVEDPEAALSITAGCHNLTGQQALGVARARHNIGDGSDISRIGRQQELVFRIIEKLFSMNVFANTQTFYQVASDITENLDTSEGLGNLTFLAGLAYSMRGLDVDTNLSFVTMPFVPDMADPNRVRPSTQADRVWQALIDDTPIPADALMQTPEQNEVVVNDHGPQSSEGLDSDPANPSNSGSTSGSSSDDANGSFDESTMGDLSSSY